jgi:mannose-1-phosphate guanylyltransferase
VDYADTCLVQLPELDRQRILAEPARRNTAPCVAYAAFVLKKRDPLANFVVTPADHLVTNEAEFTARLTSALATSGTHNVLMTLGMNPIRPETGYGYIQFRPEKSTYAPDVHPVKTFTEKPNREMAEQFIATGEFFVECRTFCVEFQRYFECLRKAHARDVRGIQCRLGAFWHGLRGRIHTFDVRRMPQRVDRLRNS